MKKVLKKLTHFSLLLILLTANLYIPHSLNFQVVSAESNPAGLDATDAQFFGANALIPDDTNDQSAKLHAILTQLESNPQPLYIPTGTYLINTSYVLPNHVQIIGDKNGATILKNSSDNEVFLGNSKNYTAKTGLHLQYLFFDNLTINTESFSDILIQNSIFYNPETDFQLQTTRGENVTIEHNIFLRDVAHTKAVTGSARWNRSIYVGGYSTSSKYQHQTNTSINGNLFGAKLNELDALKSVQQLPELTETIELLQTALKNNETVKNSLVANEQNNFTTFVNSYSTLKKAEFLQNIFYTNRDNQETGGIEQDHVVYLRGAQDVVFAGNHIRGSQNGTAGGLKFKSGRNVSVMNNYFRNSGLILYDTAEYGLSDTYEKVGELSNILVKSNQFDWKYWDGNYAIGMEYNSQAANATVKNGVFIDNHYLHFNNIPSNRKRLPRIGLEKDTAILGFLAKNNSHVSGNTRDDGINNNRLDAEGWSDADYQTMNPAWESIYRPANYDTYNQLAIPTRNTLPIPVPTTINLGDPVDAYQLVDQLNDQDEALPAATILDDSLLQKTGEQLIPVQLTYTDGKIVTINVPVTVVGTTAPDPIVPEKPTAADITDQDTKITGQSQPDLFIKLIFPDKTELTTQTQADGSFSFDIPKQKGNTSLTLIAFNKTGQESDPLTLLVQDTKKPNQPIVDPVTNQSTALSGTADPNLTYELLLPNGTTLTGQVKADGTFSIPIEQSKVGDIFKLTIIKASNNTTSDVVEIIVEDATLPAPPTIQTVFDTSTTVTGNGEPGTTAFLELPSGEISETVVNEQGIFSFPIQPQTAGSKLTAYLKRQTGTQSPSVVVVVAPTPTEPHLEVDAITTLSTNVTGKTEPNQTVSIQTADGKTYTDTSNAEGKFTIPIPLQEANQQVTITVKINGQSKTITTTVVDLTAPQVPDVEEVTDKTTQLKGQSDVGTVVIVTFADGTELESDKVTATTKAQALSGDFAVTIPLQKAGTQISVRAKKDNNLVSEPVTLTVKDVTPPAKPLITAEITTLSTVLTGQGEPLATVEITFPDGQIVQTTTDQNGLFSIPVSTLNAGDQLTIVLLDSAGNRSTPLMVTVKEATGSSTTDSSTTDSSSTDSSSKEDKTDPTTLPSSTIDSTKTNPSQNSQINKLAKKSLPETGESNSFFFFQWLGVLVLIGILVFGRKNQTSL